MVQEVEVRLITPSREVVEETVLFFPASDNLSTNNITITRRAIVTITQAWPTETRDTWVVAVVDSQSLRQDRQVPEYQEGSTGSPNTSSEDWSYRT